MRQFSFECRGGTVAVTYTVTKSWEAFWFATYSRDGRAPQWLDGMTPSEEEDSLLEQRITRSIRWIIASQRPSDF